MALINHDIYRRKYQIFVRFWFPYPSPVVSTQNVSNIENFQKVLIQTGHAKGRSDILIDKAISLLLCRVRVHHHHHFGFRARFPLPRVGLFDKSSSKTSSPLRAILRVSRVHI